MTLAADIYGMAHKHPEENLDDLLRRKHHTKLRRMQEKSRLADYFEEPGHPLYELVDISDGKRPLLFAEPLDAFSRRKIALWEQRLLDAGFTAETRQPEPPVSGMDVISNKHIRDLRTLLETVTMPADEKLHLLGLADDLIEQCYTTRGWTEELLARTLTRLFSLAQSYDKATDARQSVAAYTVALRDKEGRHQAELKLLRGPRTRVGEGESDDAQPMQSH
jgi:hypothetical protein